MKRPSVREIVALASLFAAGIASMGCNSSGRAPDNGHPGNGDGVNLSYNGQNPDGGNNMGIDPNGPDDTCTNQMFTPNKAGDPDIILIQDTSGSMADGMPSKYSRVTGALSDTITLLDKNMSPIEWGLVIFPTDDNCAVSTTLPVTVGMGHGAAVVAAIQGHMPNGSTPLAAAVKVATDYYDTLNDGRAHYLLIATDGEPNCDSGNNGLPTLCTTNAQCMMNETCMMIPLLGGICIANGGGASGDAVAVALKKGIKTYVVGIDLGGDSATLDSLAVAGGTARNGSPKYYPVTDQMSLETALGNITSQVISCSFTLASLPGTNETIEVSIGGMMIAHDTNHADGWDLDTGSKTLTFYGQACTDLQMHPAQVNVGYTCPPPG